MDSRVFVGPANIAGNAKYYALALREVGIQTTSFSYKIHPFGYECDRDRILYIPPKNRSIIFRLFVNKVTLKIIHSIQKLILLLASLLNFDAFIFIGTDTLMSRQRDLAFLKFFKKKIAFVFVGCPERNPKDGINQMSKSFCVSCQDYPLQRYVLCSNLEAKRERIEKINRYADVIFAQDDTVGFLNGRKVEKFYACTEIPETIQQKDFTNGTIRIAHFPSNSLLKGTKHVLEVKDRILDLNVEFYTNRVSNDEVKEELLRTHILIDQFSHGHGLLAVEAMARGCVVICRLEQWFRDSYPGLPIVSCDPEDLERTIRELIADPTRMKAISEAGVEYARKYHSFEAVGNHFKQALQLT